MSEPAVRAELQLTFKDGATAGLKAVTQSAEQAAKKTATTSVEAANKSADAVAKSASKSRSEYEKLSRARETLGVRPEKDIQREIRQTEAAYNRLARSGVVGARDLARAQDASIQKVRTLRNELGELTKAQRLADAAQKGAAVAAGVYAASRVIANPVRSYADLESAQADLKIALMNKGGSVSDAYGQVMQQATELGNKLPGSTKDFVAAAMALKEQGMTESAITGGGLTASAYFGVLSKMDQYQGATTIAKMREAYGLGDNELPEMANIMQKARYAYGINPDDFRAVAQYAAPTYNSLGLTGAANARELLAVQGMAAGTGLENTSYGTNFSMMLQRTAMLDSRVGGKGKEAEEVRQMLNEFGIKMNFFTKQGKFAGIENMFTQLEKLKPLSDQDRIRVLTKIFGIEAARPASIMAQQGIEGYRRSLAKLDSQADMEERIAMKTSTLSAAQEALSGTWENTKASAAKGIGEVEKALMGMVNNVLGAIQPTVDKHPGLGTGAIMGTAVGVGGAVTASALMALRATMGTSTGLRMLSAVPGIATMSSLASKFPVVPKGAGLFGLAATAGGALLSSVAGEDSVAARYGSAALSGAGLGATIGSVVPVLGTGIGAAIGGGLGLIVQGVSEALKTAPEQKPTEVKANFTVGLAPGLVLVGQNTQTSGPGNVQMNTGSMWDTP